VHLKTISRKANGRCFLHRRREGRQKSTSSHPKAKIGCPWTSAAAMAAPTHPPRLQLACCHGQPPVRRGPSSLAAMVARPLMTTAYAAAHPPLMGVILNGIDEEGVDMVSFVPTCSFPPPCVDLCRWEADNSI
jgi:hypothetical protein